MTGFFDPADFAFVPALEAAFGDVLEELQAIGPGAFVEAPDSLTSVEDGYDERGWHWFDLVENAARCPKTAAACTAVPVMQNCGFSLFRCGTQLYPHRGEIPNVLRCHLPLIVPGGDLGIRIGDETRRWQRGQFWVRTASSGAAPGWGAKPGWCPL